MRFACQPGCIRCCDQPGYVYLSEADLQRIADFLNVDRESFERRYCVRTRRILRFRKPRNRECPFLLPTGCAIHHVKPTQCGTFPFWPELLDHPKELESAARYCPGIGKGELVNITFARSEAERMRAALPHQY